MRLVLTPVRALPSVASPSSKKGDAGAQQPSYDAITAVAFAYPSFPLTAAGSGGDKGSGPSSGGVASSVLLAASDDGRVCAYMGDGGALGVCAPASEHGVTDMHVSPSSGDSIALACSDGSVRLCGLMRGAGTSPVLLKEEKSVDASAGGGACTCVRWCPDGTAFLAASESGALRVYSRAGMLRTHLVSAPRPIYAARWGPDNNSIAYACGRDISIVSLSADAPAAGRGRGGAGLTWKAHAGVILTLDWNAINARIVSGGEDCVYRVWDAATGVPLYTSSPFATVITSVCWAPSGDVFTVGTFNTLRLCASAGWSYSREKLDSGSVTALAWSAEGSSVCVGTGGGAVNVGSTILRSVSMGALTATLIAPARIAIDDGGMRLEELDFRDRVHTFAMSASVGGGASSSGVVTAGHLVVATGTQCHVYACANWHTPHIFDLRTPVSHMCVSPRHFALMDAVAGITVYTYDGRVSTSIKYAGMRTDLMSAASVSLSPDAIAVLDRTDNKTVRMFDVRTGRAIGGAPFTHTSTISHIALSQGMGGGLPERKLAFIDASHDLFLSPIVRPAATAAAAALSSVVKLSAMADSIAWNDVCDMLAVLGDGALMTWLYPHAVFTDMELALAARVRIEESSFASGTASQSPPRIIAFTGPRMALQRGDGALITLPIATYPPLLHELVSAGKWEAAVRLARFANTPALWACVAAQALAARHLDTAEIALAAHGDVDKLHFIQHVKELPLAETRACEMAMYRRAHDEAEAILLQASPPLLYRALKLNIRLARWTRALELAMNAGSHIDTVLWYRREYLSRARRPEDLETFMKAAAAAGPLDEAAIKAKKASEKDRERARAASGGGSAVTAAFGASRVPAPAPAAVVATAAAPASNGAAARGRPAQSRSPVPRSGSSASSGSGGSRTPRGTAGPASGRGRSAGVRGPARGDAGSSKLPDEEDDVPVPDL